MTAEPERRVLKINASHSKFVHVSFTFFLDVLSDFNKKSNVFFLRIQILTAALLEITEVECSTNLEILAFSMVYAPNGL